MRGPQCAPSRPPPFPRAPFVPPASTGHAKGSGQGAKSMPPLPLPSPVAARSVRPLPPVHHMCKEGAPRFACAAKWGGGGSPFPRSARALPLWGIRKGRGGLKRETRGGARRVRPLPFALTLPHCHAAPQCTPSPPGLPHVQRGSAPALHTR
jgi:hypothetical protein